MILAEDEIDQEEMEFEDDINDYLEPLAFCPYKFGLHKTNEENDLEVTLNIIFIFD